MQAPYLQTSNERLESTTVDHRLRKLRRVLGDGAKHKRRGLLVEAVLLGEGEDQLRENAIADHRLRKVFVVVREAAQRERSRLLDGRHVVHEQRAQQRHDVGILQGLNVLGPGRKVRDFLREFNARLLVFLHGLQHLTGSHGNAKAW